MNNDKENDRLIWINGNIVPVSEAKINVLAPTSQFGANVFEGIRCYWNEKKQQLYGFRLKEHYARLQQSIRLFGLKSPYSIEEFETYMKEVVRANHYKQDIAVRQTVFVDGFGSWFSTEPVGMFIAPIDKSRKKTPLAETERVCVSTWERISDRDMSPRVKVGANYINSRLAKIEATDRGYDSALFLNRHGYVAEGTGSCFFMIKDDKIITPALTDSILESITRDTVLKIAREEMRLKGIERSINRSELFTCDEAFFCGSAVEISPISEIDGFVLGNGKPGKYTVEIHKKYLQIVTGENEKYIDWNTPIYVEGE